MQNWEKMCTVNSWVGTGHCMYPWALWNYSFLLKVLSQNIQRHQWKKKYEGKAKQIQIQGVHMEKSDRFFGNFEKWYLSIIYISLLSSIKQTCRHTECTELIVSLVFSWKRARLSSLQILVLRPCRPKNQWDLHTVKPVAGWLVWGPRKKIR